MDSLEENFEVLVVDAPGVVSSEYVFNVLQHVAEPLFVIGSNQTKRRYVESSFEEFEALTKRLRIDRVTGRPTIIIPAGTCGQASGANDLIRVTKREILTRNLTDKIGLRVTGCHGFCEMEPSVLIEPGNVFYPTVKMKDMVRIIDAVIQGEVVEDTDPTLAARPGADLAARQCLRNPFS